MNEARDLYLDLMKRILMNMIYADLESALSSEIGIPAGAPDPEDVGAQWPAVAHTMLSSERLDNIRVCLEDCIEKGVPGDFLEAGVWRGGACIFARAILRAHGVQDRVVWVADSFEGVPPPNPIDYPLDKGIPLHLYSELAVSRSQVEQNFEKYGLLDDQVEFIEGWFKDSLTEAPIRELAVLRLDGDLYESTMDTLKALFHKVSVGGYVIVDDYGVIHACKKAVDDFRETHGITSEIIEVDPCAVYWQKEESVE